LVQAGLRLLEPLYEGENPLEPERVSEKLHANTFWMGRGGSITHAISGIDIAMWDILGKATGQPVGRLLGGRYRDRVRPYEEPLQPDNLHDFVLLRNSSPVLIAGGEVLTRRQSFTPWLEQRAFDIVQPDVTKVGGISEERRIAWMAQECGVRFIPHGWNTALGLAADLQLASAFADTDLVEYLNGSPFIDKIAAAGWHLDAEGMLAIPALPGL